MCPGSKSDGCFFSRLKTTAVKGVIHSCPMRGQRVYSVPSPLRADKATLHDATMYPASFLFAI